MRLQAKNALRSRKQTAGYWHPDHQQRHHADGEASRERRGKPIIRPLPVTKRTLQSFSGVALQPQALGHSHQLPDAGASVFKMMEVRHKSVDTLSGYVRSGGAVLREIDPPCPLRLMQP